MNLYHLVTYLEVVKLGSLSRAARKLFLSQPAVSFQIRKLEQELGFRLIERDKNKFSVTREGKRFFRFAEYVTQEHKHLLYDLSQMHQGVTGNLSVISSPIIGEFLLPPVLSEFKEHNPSIEITMTIAESFKVIEEVEKGASTIGFCGTKIEREGLEFIKIGEDEQVLIVYPGHPFSNREEVTVADLMGESLIMRAEPAERRQMYREALMKVGFDIDRYQPKLILGTTTGVISSVESRSGIALISDLAIKKSEAMGLVKVLKIKDLKLKRDLFCVYKKESLTDPLLKNFIEFVKNRMK